MIHNNETVTFNMKIKPCIIMDQSGARCMGVKHSKIAARRVSIVEYNTGKNQSDCTKLSQVFKNYSMKQHFSPTWMRSILVMQCSSNKLPSTNPIVSPVKFNQLKSPVLPSSVTKPTVAGLLEYGRLKRKVRGLS